MLAVYLSPDTVSDFFDSDPATRSRLTFFGTLRPEDLRPTLDRDGSRSISLAMPDELLATLD